MKLQRPAGMKEPVATKLNSVTSLNPASNELTDFMDFLVANQYAGGIMTTEGPPLFSLRGRFWPASGYDIPEKEDLIDYLEALEIETENEKLYDYTHAFIQEDGTSDKVLFRIRIILDSKELAVTFRTIQRY